MIDKKISIIYLVASLSINRNSKQFEKHAKHNFTPSQNNANGNDTYRFAVRRTVCFPWWI